MPVIFSIGIDILQAEVGGQINDTGRFIFGLRCVAGANLCGCIQYTVLGVLHEAGYKFLRVAVGQAAEYGIYVNSIPFYFVHFDQGRQV